NWLFYGGPEPKAIVCPPAAGKGLPSTGQTKCFDHSGAEIPCDNENCPGQDGRYLRGCPADGGFGDNGDETVTDNCTGLMWQKDTADTSPDDGGAVRWCDALAYCENLSFGGHDDWRLPNIRELQSLVDYGRFNPAIDPVFGTLSPRDVYWSSTSIAVNPSHAWHVRFYSGESSIDESKI